jgi:predicted nucleic acid-binding protein
MSLVLDASMTLAWRVTRPYPNEALIAQNAIHTTMSHGAIVPHLWYPEVANALVMSERQGVSTPKDSANFLADLDSLPISLDTASVQSTRNKTLSFARTWKLTVYDATYFELALRKNASLATFDRQLAEAFRKAGGRVFGDQP